MKLRYGSIVLVLVIFVAVLIAGCTTSSPSGPAATATPASTTGPSGPSLDFGKLKVLEYKITSTVADQTTEMNLRWEFEATQVRQKMTIGGQVIENTFPIDQASGGASSAQGGSMLGEAMDPDFSTSVTSAGVETITVPKGPFTCTKYAITSSGVTTTYWIANNVPLPIKMTQEQGGKLTMKMELVDYQV